MVQIVLLQFSVGNRQAVKLITKGTVKELSEIARKYEMPELSAACFEFCNSIQLEVNYSTLEWGSFAREYNISDFAVKCERFIYGRADQLFKVLTDQQMLEHPTALLMLARGLQYEVSIRLKKPQGPCQTCMLRGRKVWSEDAGWIYE